MDLVTKNGKNFFKLFYCSIIRYLNSKKNFTLRNQYEKAIEILIEYHCITYSRERNYTPTPVAYRVSMSREDWLKGKDILGNCP